MTVEQQIEQIFNNAKQECITLIKRQTFVRMDLRQATTSNYHAIVRIICELLNVDEGELFKRNRHREIADARHISMYILNDIYGPTRMELAKFFNLDHTSVIHALKTIRNRLHIRDASTVEAIEKIHSKIKLHEQ